MVLSGSCFVFIKGAFGLETTGGDPPVNVAGGRGAPLFVGNHAIFVGGVGLPIAADQGLNHVRIDCPGLRLSGHLFEG